MSYVAMETLEGANQYKCGSCHKHVDASKVCVELLSCFYPLMSFFFHLLVN